MKMNEAMKMANIRSYFAEMEKTIDSNVVYGYIEPRKRDFFLWGALSAFKQKHYIVAFYPDEIILVELTAGGNFSDERIMLAKEDINSLDVKKGLMQYKINIQTNDEKLKLKCNKFIINKLWQKENTTYLEEVDWYGDEFGII